MKTNWTAARQVRKRLFFAAAALAVATSALAVVPLIAGLGKQILQNMILGEVKGQLIGSLAQMGCKGAALAGMIATIDARHAAAGAAKVPLPTGAAMPDMAGAGGGATPSGGGGILGSLRNAMHSMVGGSAPQDRIATPADAAAHPAIAEAQRITGGPVHIVGGNIAVAEKAPSLPDAYAAAQREMAAAARQSPLAAMSGIGAATQLDPEQAAQVNQIMGQMQDAMSKPLSRAETLAVFDEMARVGVLTPAMQSEARDCILLAPPSADAALGQTGAMLKSMLLPQLQTMKQRFADLTPQDQQRLADELTQALSEADAKDRKAFSDGFGLGFFPPGVVQRVRASGILK